jgi:RNA polymerase sigma-70 factor (ECF subfamily)
MFSFIIWKRFGKPRKLFLEDTLTPMTREESIEIYNRYSRKLFNVSLRIVGDAGEAEEIMQDTVLKFIRRGMGGQEDSVGSGERGCDRNVKGGDDSERMVAAWMVRTCVRASIDAVRKRKRERQFLEEYAEVSGSENEEVEMRGMDIHKIKRAISEMPDSYRIMLTLVLIEGLDYEEISEITGESEGALRTRYSRARKMLAARLIEMKDR